MSAARTVTAETTIQEFLRSVRDTKYERWPVVGDNGRITGVIDSYDIALDTSLMTGWTGSRTLALTGTGTDSGTGAGGAGGTGTGTGGSGAGGSGAGGAGGAGGGSTGTGTGGGAGGAGSQQ